MGTFKEVSQYLKQRMESKVDVTPFEDRLEIRLTHKLGDRFDHPLTLTTRLPGHWDSFTISQGENEISFKTSIQGATSHRVRYNAMPNNGTILIQKEH